MHKHDKPVFKADDGSIHDTAHKAAAHDALNIFKTMFNQYTRDGDHVPPDAMAAKWQEIRTRLNTLHDEFIRATEAPKSEPDRGNAFQLNLPTDKQVTESLSSR